MHFTIYELFALFLIYSFLGWCAEVVFVAVTSGRVVNRGFLNGPVCPIYGCGMLVVLVLLEPISDRTPVLFLGGMVLCSGVELCGGWILAKVFHTRWWDYSEKPLNLGGYICLSYSIMWGLAATFAVRLVHPALMALVEHVPHTFGVGLLIVDYSLFLADLTVTVIAIAGISRRIRELERVAQALHALGDNLSGHVGGTALAADARLDNLRETGQEKLSEGRERVTASIESGKEKLNESREKVSASIESGREKLSESREKVSASIESGREILSEKRARLEARQQQLLREYRSRFGLTRLLRAFPDIRRALPPREDREDRED